MFLLIDKGSSSILLPYAERYVLFDSFDDCLRVARERGYTGFLAPTDPSPPKPGILCSYVCGDIDISYMGIERV